MKVRMLVQITGTRNGKPWPPIGETVEVGDGEGVDLCSTGAAEPVAEKPKSEKRPAAKRTETRKA